MYTKADEMKTRAIQKIAQKIPEMTLRDIFAMQVLNGLLSHSVVMSDDKLVQRSYEIADLMMSARGKND